MDASAPPNGQTSNRVSDLTRNGAPDDKSKRSGKGAGAPTSGPFAKLTRLCLYVPRHIVTRLEQHAEAQGESRDVFAAKCLGKYMQTTYGKRDQHLRDAYNVDAEPEDTSQNKALREAPK